jgi:hypothetical protein
VTHINLGGRKMGLKKESESDHAHRVFKFYKATGKFPPDTPILDCYNLLVKYNYFISNSIDKDILKSLTELCIILNKEKIVIMYGDFMLKTLDFGLRQFFITNNKPLDIQYIDCATNGNITEYFGNSVTIRSHLNHYIVYILDNINTLKYKHVDFLLKQKDRLFGHDKAIVCCCINSTKLSASLQKLRRIKMGEEYKEQNNYQRAVYHIFSNPNRVQAYETITGLKINEHYLMKLLGFNLTTFFDIDEVIYNSELINKCCEFVYKTKKQNIYKMLVFGFKTTNRKKAVRFPPSELTKKKKEIESESIEEEQE